jgi:hypothetical protein
MAGTLDSILNVVVPILAIAGIVAIFWKPFRLGDLVGWLGAKLQEWREENPNKQKNNPADRFNATKEARLVFE